MAHKPLTNEEVSALIRQGENDYIEFKLEDEYQTELAEVLMSQANTGLSSYLIIGVEDHPIKVRGVKSVKAVTDKLVNAARQVVPTLVPYLHISSHTVATRIVIVASLPANVPDVYHVAGKYLKRHGSQKIPITAEELLRLMYHRGHKSYENQPVPKATLDDIDWLQVDRYLERRAHTRNTRIPPDIDRVELLHKLEVITEDGVPTVAGILFFGKDPQSFFPSQLIKAARFSDNTTREFIDREVIAGTIPDMIDSAYRFVARNIRHGAKIVGLQRIDQDEYPAEAVREILANACVHRDLAINDSAIRCHIFSNRIEIDSPGGLLPGVTLENLLRVAKLRNRKLAELLYHIGYVEAEGTGIGRVVKLMSEAGLQSPKFDDLGVSLFVTLPGPDYGEAEKSQKEATFSLGILPFSKMELVGLNLRQRKFLSALVNSGRLTRNDYERTFEVSSQTATNDLRVLQDRKLIELEREGSFYYYKLISRETN